MSTYTISAIFTSGTKLVAEDVPYLAEAKRQARDLYDDRKPMAIEIVGSDGRRIEATQPHGRGMRWTRA